MITWCPKRLQQTRLLDVPDNCYQRDYLTYQTTRINVTATSQMTVLPPKRLVSVWLPDDLCLPNKVPNGTYQCDCPTWSQIIRINCDCVTSQMALINVTVWRPKWYLSMWLWRPKWHLSMWLCDVPNGTYQCDCVTSQMVLINVTVWLPKWYLSMWLCDSPNGTYQCDCDVPNDTYQCDCVTSQIELVV